MADHVLSFDKSCGARKRPSSNLPLLMILVAVLIIIAGEGVFHLVVAPRLTIESFVIESDLPVSREELLAKAGLNGVRYFFATEPSEIVHNLQSWPSVRQAWVERVFPDTLRIRVESRRPLAVVFAETGSGIVPLTIDREGVVFAGWAADNGQSLPVFSGLRFEGSPLGARLPPVLHPILSGLDELQREAPALFNYISELRLQRTEAGGAEFLLYPVTHRVPVRIGARIDQELCRMIIMVLDVMQKQHILDQIEEIDFRTGDIVYRLKER